MPSPGAHSPRSSPTWPTPPPAADAHLRAASRCAHRAGGAGGRRGGAPLPRLPGRGAGLASNTLSLPRDLHRYAGWLAAAGIDDLARAGEPDLVAFRRAAGRQHPGRDPLPASSVARSLAAVRGFHRFLVRERLAGTDPSRDLGTPKVPASLPKALSVEQVEALLGAIAGHDQLALRDRALLETLYAAGLRVSEATALDVDDLDLEDGTVRAFGKGAKERLVLSRSAPVALEGYLVRPPAAGRAAVGARPVPERPGEPADPPGLLEDPAPPRPATPGWRRRCPRTCCATRSPLTCWPAGPTSAASRSCSATPAWPRPRCTRGHPGPPARGLPARPPASPPHDPRRMSRTSPTSTAVARRSQPQPARRESTVVPSPAAAGRCATEDRDGPADR